MLFSQYLTGQAASVARGTQGPESEYFIFGVLCTGESHTCELETHLVCGQHLGSR